MRHTLYRVKGSAILQGALALLCWGIIGYLAIMEREIPGVLVAGASSITGYFFRTNNHKEESE